MNADQIPQAARRVLDGINQMLTIYFWKSALQPRMPTEADLELPLVALENACIDSSLVALRAFEDFVRSARRRPTDLVAEDFPGLALKSTGMPPDERDKINQYIAHLTHLDLGQDTRAFSYRACLSAVIQSAIGFCEYVIEETEDHDGLHDFAAGTKEVCQAVRNSYVTRIVDAKCADGNPPETSLPPQ